MEPKNLIEFFERSVEKYPDNVLLWEKKDKYKGLTYKDGHDRVNKLAAGFLSIGVSKGDRVALISEGRNDWLLSELALLFCNAASVPLSVKLDEPDDLIFRINHSGCKGIIVSGNHSHKVFSVIEKLGTVEFVVLLDPIDEKPAGYEKVKEVIFIEDLAKDGESFLAKKPTELEKVKQSVGPHDIANICYTSGTTADPKGIMLTHENYIWNTKQGSAIFEVPSHYTSLHILPWDHSFAHTVGLYALIFNGASIASLKTGKTLNETLRNIPICINEVQPHFLLSVPALAKNFKGNIEKGVKSKGKIAWALFSAGVKAGYAYNREGHNKGKGWAIILLPFYKLIDKILFSKLRQNFGGRLKFFVGGGALLDIDLQRFFYAIGMPMYQGYGLTEASPVISSNTPDVHKLGSSGKVVPFMELKICDEDGNELPQGKQGEIVIKGKNVMAGYWNNETATKDTIKDGWLHTGDLGYLDKEGYLYVLGRSKSLLISSDGEKYSPEGIEEAMVEKVGIVEQAFLYNNQNPYTVGILVLNKAKVKAIIEKLNIDPTTEQGQIDALKKLRSEVAQFMPGTQSDQFPQRWLPTSVLLLDEPFSEQNRMMNSTMKMVRPAITKHYQKELDFLYTPEGKVIENQLNKDFIARITAK
jgi:long-chain acyl-CoA synthetase